MFSGASLYFLLVLLFARYSPFYLCLFLFSFAFLSPYSAYFGVLSNFLTRFLDSLYVFYFLFGFFFGHSVSFFSSYFHLKPSLHKLESQQFPPVDKVLALPVLLLCELIRNWELLFNFNLTSLISLSIICSRGFTFTGPCEALVQCLTMCPRHATLKLYTRVCALHSHLPVFPGAH